MKILLFFMTTSIVSGCSLGKWFTPSGDDNDLVDLSSYHKYDDHDYIKQVSYYEDFFLNSSEVHKIQLQARHQVYLKSIAKKIINNNELFFESKNEPEIIIIEDELPYHFSVPGRHIFLSSSLVKKYIKSESLLYCVLAFELIRSEKKIYRKRIISPIGLMSRIRILSLMKLGTMEKVEMHKWAFYLLKRAGIDPDNYLSWIQIQNRNSIDFATHLGDLRSISREESMFKAFLIENKNKMASNRHYEGSSKMFYDFVSGI